MALARAHCPVPKAALMPAPCALPGDGGLGAARAQHRACPLASPPPSRPAERGAARGRSGVWWRARAAPARSRRGGGGDGGGSPAAQAHIRVLPATRRGDVTRWRGQHGGGKNERPSPAGPGRRAAGGLRGPARAGPAAPLPTCCPARPLGWTPRNLVGCRGAVGLEAVGRRLLSEEHRRGRPSGSRPWRNFAGRPARPADSSLPAPANFLRSGAQTSVLPSAHATPRLAAADLQARCGDSSLAHL